MLAVLAVIGLQLLPRDGRSSGCAVRVQALPSRRRSALGLASVVLVVAATVPSQGVPPFIYFQF